MNGCGQIERDNEKSSSLVESWSCPVCRRTFPSSTLLEAHGYIHTLPQEVYENNHARIVLSRASLEGLARDFEMFPTESVHDLEGWLTDQADLLHNVLRPLTHKFVVKGRIIVKIQFVKVDPQTGLVLKRQTFYIS